MNRSIKRKIKTFLRKIWLLCGAPCGLASGDAVIITYHSLAATNDTRPETPIRIPLTVFLEHLAWLEARFTLVHLDELCVMTPAERKAAGRLCVLTFDDGWADNFALLPLLRQRKLPVTIFLCTGFTGTDKIFWWEALTRLRQAYMHRIAVHSVGALFHGIEHPDSTGASSFILEELLRQPEEVMLEQAKRLPAAMLDALITLGETSLGPAFCERNALSWKEVRTLHEAGCRFGAHTQDHVILPLADTGTAWQEIVAPVSLLHLHCPSVVTQDTLNNMQQSGRNTAAHGFCFSYPNGNHGQREMELIRKAGYVCAVTTCSGIVPADIRAPFALQRVDSAGKHTGEALLFAIFLIGIRHRLRRLLP